jgi:hypothetical protein
LTGWLIAQLFPIVKRKFFPNFNRRHQPHHKNKHWIFKFAFQLNKILAARHSASVTAGNTNWGERLSTVALLTKVACFVKKVNDNFNI